MSLTPLVSTPELTELMRVRLQPPPDFLDPRLGADYVPEHWPQCNGQDVASWEEATLHERRCIEFLAAFYRLNVLQAALLEARGKGSKADPEPSRWLQEISSATSALEGLEDRYAPIGFFGEPTMDGVYYRNILFVKPELPKEWPQAASISSEFVIPGLEDIPESELKGEAHLLRWNHGKVGV